MIFYFNSLISSSRIVDKKFQEVMVVKFLIYKKEIIGLDSS